MIGTILRYELMKWKRLYLVPAIVIAILIPPLLTGFSMSMKIKNTGAAIHWEDVLGLCLQVDHLFIFPLLFSSLTAFVFVHEFQTRSIIPLFTLPIKRTKIVTLKMFLLFFVILILSILSHLLILCVGYFFIKEPISKAFIDTLPLSIETGLMQISYVPIYMCICLWARQYVLPIVTGGIFIMTAFVALAIPKIGPFLFPALPYFTILQGIGWSTTDIPLVWSQLIPISIFFFILSLWIANKRDIH